MLRHISGISRIIMWSFPDPSTFTGSDEEIMEQVRVVRDTIEAKVQEFIQFDLRDDLWF